MTLAQVLNGVQLRRGLISEWANLTVAGLEYDSRRIEKDFVFFAFPGSRTDGRKFAEDAVSRGACAIVSESPCPAGFAAARPPGFATPWIEVEHGRRALAVSARNFYGKPDERVAFTGVTGTNGKTTTTYLIDALLRAAGKTTAMIGTIEYRMAGELRPALNTTPESLDVMRMAAELSERGGTHLTMEVSSHALALGRVYGFEFHTAVFTNLTRDHLDFHGTMEEYAAAKRQLFQPPAAGLPHETPGPRWAILNADDPASREMAPSSGANVVRYGLRKSADLRAENIRSGFQGVSFDAVYQGERHAVSSPLVGGVNVSNILAALGAGISYEIPLAEAARGVAACTAVPGRFERVDEGQPFLVVVDYAHTDDALRNAIQIVRELGKGRVITLFGCGGDRDRTKRPLMGVAAGELSDFVVLTSDNPRSEDPLDIMNDAMVGLSRFDTPRIAEPDRERAIRKALEEARPGDAVLLAGKGHETYQILKDRTIHFDDRETARQVLRSLGYEKKSE